MLFACLICKKRFVSDENYQGDVDNEIPVMTTCGHYFHLNCLQHAFVHQNISCVSNRKTCPYSNCSRELNNSALIKIHPVQIEDEKTAQTVASLTEELNYLKTCIENRTHFEIGDKVAFKTAPEGVSGTGVVKQVLVELQMDTSTTTINNSSTVNQNSWREIWSNKLIHSIGSFSNEQTQTLTIPTTKVKLVTEASNNTAPNKDLNANNLVMTENNEALNNQLQNTEPQNNSRAEYSSSSNNTSLRPKWEAGERIYLPREKEYATIKWIGSRQYRFDVVLEYDHAIGDDGFESDDLPFLIKRGYGKRLSIEELNEIACKVSETLGSRFLKTIHKWGFDRLRPAINNQPAIFYLEYSGRRTN